MSEARVFVCFQLRVGNRISYGEIHQQLQTPIHLAILENRQ